MNGAAHLAQALLAHPTPAVVRALAEALPRLEQPGEQQEVLKVLSETVNPEVLDELWAVWSETRLVELGALLKERGLPAVYPPALKVLSLLWLDQSQALNEAGADWIETLLHAAQDSEPLIAQSARRTLRQLKQTAAQEELCRWVIETGSLEASQAAVQAGYAPRLAQPRALFYLLTGQWERYEKLDFDLSLLRAIYEAGDAALRGQVARLARSAGWSGFVEAVAGSRSEKRLGELTEIEWEVVLALLGRDARWQAAWQLAQAAPPRWSARLLRALHEAGWSPSEVEEQAGFKELAQAATSCLQAGAPVEKLAGFPRTLEGHTRPVLALAFTPDGGLLVSAAADKTARLWRLPGGEALRTLENHSSYVLSLAVSPDGKLLATGSGDKTVRLWRLPEGAGYQILAGHAGEVTRLEISQDGRWLVSADNRALYTWRLPEGEAAAVQKGEAAGLVDLRMRPGGDQLVSGHLDKTMRLWRFPGLELQRALLDTVVGWGMSAAGDLLACANSYGGVRLWRLPEGDAVKSLKGRADGKLVAVEAQGRWLACSDRSLVRLWRLPEEEPAGVLEEHPSMLSALVFSPDGRLLASGCEDGSLRLWSLPEMKLLAALEGGTAPVRCLAFSPQGETLVSADGPALRLWPIEDLGQCFRLPMAEMTQARLEWIRSLRPRSELGEVERSWLDFSLALAQWRRRHDIHLTEASQPITIGEFDIEIE